MFINILDKIISMTEYIEKRLEIYKKYKDEIEKLEKELEKIEENEKRTSINIRYFDWNTEVIEILDKATEIWENFMKKKFNNYVIKVEKNFGLDNGFINFTIYKKEDLYNEDRYLVFHDFHLYFRLHGHFGEWEVLHIYMPNLISTRILKDYVRKV